MYLPYRHSLLHLACYYRKSVSSDLPVKKLLTEFFCCCTSTSDSESSQRDISETIEQIHDTMLADRTLKVCKILEAIGVLRGSVVLVLIDHFDMRKLSAREVLSLLTVDH